MTQKHRPKNNVLDKIIKEKYQGYEKCLKGTDISIEEARNFIKNVELIELEKRNCINKKKLHIYKTPPYANDDDIKNMFLLLNSK